MSTFYEHNNQKKSGDGLATTEWNELSNAVAGNQGLHLALGVDYKVGIGTNDPKSKLDVEGGVAIGATYSGTNPAPSDGLLVEGNVGIGTTNPREEKLEVNGNAIIGESGETFKIGNIGLQGWAGIAHTNRANSKDYALIQNSDGATILNSKSNELLHFRQGNSNKMVIKNGNVGIGTAIPSEKLEVNGIVKATTGFEGDGSSLTNLDASSIMTGIISRARLPEGLLTEDDLEYEYAIGDSPELGGYVFSLSEDKKHGLVVANRDQDPMTRTWYDAQNIINMPDKHDVHGGRFRDWRLPTKYETSQMIREIEEIRNLQHAYYWTSTETAPDNADAAHLLQDGRLQGYNKSSECRVRAVRAF